jgi:autotransporter-associated beta strand protein
MNTPHLTTRIIHGLTIAVLAFSLRPADAASGTWTELAADGNWQNDANWSASPFPGNAANVYTSVETATFGMEGGGAINLGGTLNVGGISFGGGGSSAGAFILGDADDTLNLTSAGSILARGGVISNQAVGVAGTIINLSTANNSSSSFLNFGSGTLTFAGAVTANQSAGNASILNLGGSGNGVISGALTNAGSAGSAGLALTKNGSGAWTLSGANTYSGTTTVSGGRLVFDYSSEIPVSSSAPVVINGGGLGIKGQSSGFTTSSLISVTLGGSAAAINSLTLDSNGGSGVELTIGTLNGFTSSLSGSLIDLSSSSGNSISVDALGANISVANGVLMGGIGGSSSGRATLVVRDSMGYGFATLSGATSGTIGRLTAGTTLSAGNASATTNYRLTDAGTLTRTANLNYSTLTIDSSAGDVTLEMSTFHLAATANGRGILITGSNDVSIIGSGNMGAGPIIHNYGTGTFSLSLASGSFATTFLGTGFTDYSGIITSTAGNGGFVIGGGIVRLSGAQTIPTTTPYYVTGGGILEVGADLNGVGAGDFSATVGATGSSLRFFGDSGMSAAGADRVVNFGGFGATLTWGSAGFLTNADGATDGGYTLKLSSARSDARLTIENSIALGTNTSRVIDVANGTAAIDATLSGTLSGSGAILTKTGTGTLELTSANTYSGGTVVSAGTLLINNTAGSGAGSGNVSVNDGGTLGGSGAFSGEVTVNAGGVLRPGASIETLESGALTMNGGSTLGYEVDSSVAASVGADLLKVSGDLSFTDIVTLTLDDIAGAPSAFAPGTTFSLINYTGAWNGGLLTFNGNTIANGGFFTAGLNTWQLVYNATSGGSNFAGEYGGGSFVNITAVPEPSAVMFLLGGLGVLACLRRRG